MATVLFSNLYFFLGILTPEYAITFFHYATVTAIWKNLCSISLELMGKKDLFVSHLSSGGSWTGLILPLLSQLAYNPSAMYLLYALVVNNLRVTFFLPLLPLFIPAFYYTVDTINYGAVIPRISLFLPSLIGNQISAGFAVINSYKQEAYRYCSLAEIASVVFFVFSWIMGFGTSILDFVLLYQFLSFKYKTNKITQDYMDFAFKKIEPYYRQIFPQNLPNYFNPSGSRYNYNNWLFINI